MSGTCCEVPLRTVQDTCLKVTKHCGRCKRVYVQWKRRPAGLDYKSCSWKVPCLDHPEGRLFWIGHVRIAEAQK